MIKREIFTNVKKNGIETTIRKVNGKILKVFIRTKQVYSNLNIEVRTRDAETIFSLNNLPAENRKNVMVFYPYNVISGDNELRREDYFYSIDPLHIKVEGLGTNELIEEISIYYETNIISEIK